MAIMLIIDGPDTARAARVAAGLLEMPIGDDVDALGAWRMVGETFEAGIRGVTVAVHDSRGAFFALMDLGIPLDSCAELHSA